MTAKKDRKTKTQKPVPPHIRLDPEKLTSELARLRDRAAWFDGWIRGAESRFDVVEAAQTEQARLVQNLKTGSVAECLADIANLDEGMKLVDAQQKQAAHAIAQLVRDTTRNLEEMQLLAGRLDAGFYPEVGKRLDAQDLAISALRDELTEVRGALRGLACGDRQAGDGSIEETEEQDGKRFAAIMAELTSERALRQELEAALTRTDGDVDRLTAELEAARSENQKIKEEVKIARRARDGWKNKAEYNDGRIPDLREALERKLESYRVNLVDQEKALTNAVERNRELNEELKHEKSRVRMRTEERDHWRKLWNESRAALSEVARKMWGLPCN
jgi:chromosome segregation ATPase